MNLQLNQIESYHFMLQIAKTYREALETDEEFFERINKTVYYLEERNHKVKDITPILATKCIILFDCKNPVTCDLCNLVIK